MIIVETERLLLRHFHHVDAEAIYRVLGDAEVMRFSSGVMTIDAVHDWLQDCLDHVYPAFGFGPWALVDKASQSVIGYCGLFYFLDMDGQPEIEIGYRLMRGCWGHGYATEAACAVRDYAFTVLASPRLIALIDPQNTASIHVAEKIGMRYVKDFMFPGYSHPDQLYAMANPFLVRTD